MLKIVSVSFYILINACIGKDSVPTNKIETYYSSGAKKMIKELDDFLKTRRVIQFFENGDTSSVAAVSK